MPEKTQPPAAKDMALRDWFAGQIAGAIFAERSIAGLDHVSDKQLSDAAEFTYRVADALVAEGEKNAR